MFEIKQNIRRYTRSIAVIAIVGMTMALAPTISHAAGLLIADGGFGGVLEIEEHTVTVTINNGIAVTNVTQVFAIPKIGKSRLSICFPYRRVRR